MFVAGVPLAMSTHPQATVLSPPLPHPRAQPRQPPAPKRVSIADRCARSFPPAACVRGFRYFARKRVDLVRVSEGAIDADVRGTRTLRVCLRVDDGSLGSACSCPAKVVGPAACRHVWATLLEIDRCGALETLRTTQRSLTLGAVEATKPASARARPSATAKHPPKAKPPVKAPARPRGAAAGGGA